MTPEGKVKEQVSKLLKSYGSRIYYNMPVPCGYGKSMLDYVGCAAGDFFMVETKKKDGKPRPLQELCKREVLAAGGAVFVIDSVESASFTEFAAWLVERLGLPDVNPDQSSTQNRGGARKRRPS